MCHPAAKRGIRFCRPAPASKVPRSLRAAVLAYITNQLLRTFAAIRREEAAAPTQIIFDAPRPIRD
jgi:hypothetical protein